MSTLVIITGHSQGLGKSLAAQFLTRSAVEVIGISRRISGLSSENLKEISLDLADLTAVKKVLPQLFPEGSYAKIILVNNAGWIGAIKPLDKQEVEEIEAINAINFLSPTLLCQYFLNQYKESEAEKVICNISSGLAYRPESGLTGYCASKASLAMLTEVMNLEEHPNTSFFSLAPGVIDTPMQDEIRAVEPANFPKLEMFQNLKASGSLVSADETAKKVAYLLDHPERFDGVVQDVRKYELG